MKYLLKALKGASFKRLKDTIDSCHKKCKKTKIGIFFDMIRCLVLYKAGYVDYELFSFYDLSRKQRKTIITRGKNNDFVKLLNSNKEYWKYIENKNLFNKKFKKYLNREFLKLDSNNYKEFEKFLKDKEYIFVKPIDATGGKDVEKIKVSDYETKKLYNKLINNKQTLIEEVAKQHKDVSKLHPSSVNTIRVVTIRNKYGVTSLVAAVIRIGTGGRVVDNFHSHGIYAPIDKETGVINGNAYGRDWKYHKKHPTTGITFIGYQLPFWEEVKKLALSAHEEIPELGFIGWDICIGEKRPSLIEGNVYPGYDLYRREDGYGYLPVFKEALRKTKEE